MCLRNICGIKRVDRVRGRCRCELSVLERIERDLLKWFGHVKRRLGRKGWLREDIGQI